MTKKYRSKALAAVHEAALGLRDAGVMDKHTMKAFDAMCLMPIKPLTPAPTTTQRKSTIPRRRAGTRPSRADS